VGVSALIEHEADYQIKRLEPNGDTTPQTIMHSNKQKNLKVKRREGFLYKKAWLDKTQAGCQDQLGL
jgi:hypothetical protein